MVNFAENFSLKQFNTFGFEVKTRYWATFSNDYELSHIIKHCKANSLNWFVLGGGSNIIFSKDYDGVVIHPKTANILRDGELVISDAGVEWDDLVEWSVAQGLGGLENLSFIPGSVGASPVQNIGAYGAEVKDTMVWAEYLDTDTQQIIRIANKDCAFGYRESVFKNSLRGKAVVLRVAFKLSTDPKFNIEYGDVKAEVDRLAGVSLANIRQAIINIRSAKLPDPKVTGNAGSFFKNPVIEDALAFKLLEKYPEMPNYEVGHGRKIPAGWLIDRSGWKGRRDGDAGVHPNQALVLVNYGTATAKDILCLADKIVDDIYEKFGVMLEKEVNIW